MRDRGWGKTRSVSATIVDQTVEELVALYAAVVRRIARKKPCALGERLERRSRGPDTELQRQRI